MNKCDDISPCHAKRPSGCRFGASLEALRSAIHRLEGHDESHPARRVPLGHRDADHVLQGGLALGTLHEVFARESRHAAAATGFAAGLARRAMGRKTLLWVRQDFAARECGELHAQGLAELGLDPRRLVMVHAAAPAQALRAAAEGIACDAIGTVVLEIFGDTKLIDLVTSRRLTLAAARSGVTAFVSRLGAMPCVSTAETRWCVRGTTSLAREDWGAPVFAADLVRNRHGATGQWIMEWNSDDGIFRDGAAHSQPVAAAPANRPHPAFALARRAG